VNFKVILDYLRGYVHVEVRGKNPERLINLCLSSGFPIWDIDAVDGKVEFSTSLSRYKEIRKLASKSRCIPKVKARKGLPFVVARVRKRPAFLISGMLVLMVFTYLSGAVWAISVRGHSAVPRETILGVAAREGLRIGARKNLVSPSRVENALLLEIPRLSWAYVHFQGTLAVIEVVEKVRPDTPLPGDIVAKKDGLVESVLVLSGIPVVKPGQTVKKGEILIAGDPSDPNGAKGTVTARTWYQVYKEVPLVQKNPVRTGRKLEVRILRAGTREIQFFGARKLFEWYEIEDYPVWTFPEGNEAPLVEVINRTFYEVTWEEARISPQEAGSIGEKRAIAAIQSQLPSSVKLVDLACDVKETEKGLVVVQVTCCAIEEIGEIRPWPKQDLSQMEVVK